MRYIERHFDYVLGPNQDSQLISLPAGQTIQLALRLASDAPFVLRSRAVRIAYLTSDNSQNGVQHILAKHYGPERNQLSQSLVRQSLLSPYLGQVGNPVPQYPEVFYPPNGEIRLDVRNDGTSALSNVYFYFRGVKLYRPGAVKAYTYPADFALQGFIYNGNNNNNSLTPTVAVTTTGQLVTFKCRTDADFVLQAIQSGFIGNKDASGNLVQEMFLQLMDEDQKPYSNDYVHADVLAGNSGVGAVFPGSAGNLAPVMGGPNLPGLVFPEIYIPKNQLMYIQLKRDDGAYGTQAVQYPISLIGQKVFLK
jgi:hypothetical protein